MADLRPSCERQTGVIIKPWVYPHRLPYAQICPHFALPDSPFCERHQPEERP